MTAANFTTFEQPNDGACQARKYGVRCPATAKYELWWRPDASHNGLPGVTQMCPTCTARWRRLAGDKIEAVSSMAAA